MEPEIEVVHHKRTNVVRSTTGSINNSDDHLESHDFAVKVSFWHQFWALVCQQKEECFKSSFIVIYNILIANSMV